MAYKKVELSSNLHSAKAQAHTPHHPREIACNSIYLPILWAYRPPHHHNFHQDSAR